MKPYLVVCVNNGVVGFIYERANYTEAVTLAHSLAKKECPGYDDEEIYRQLEENMEFYDSDVSITLAQTEDD